MFIKDIIIRYILDLFFKSSKRKPNTMFELVDSIIDTFDDTNFVKEAKKTASKWIDVDFDVLKSTIIDFISKI